MILPVPPPVAPMLAKPVKQIPDGELSFEPKWDGFRSIVFRDGDEIEIGSRNERPMTRYFPELAAAFREQLPPRCVVDGEIILVAGSGDRLDFETLQLRLHPAASRVKMLSETTPARFVAFDLLALGDDDLTGRPFAQRRRALEEALKGVEPPIHVTPATTDRDVAQRWFHQFEGAGLDGLIAKPLGGVYEPDKRAMFKIKHERTADCVVAGYRVHTSGADRIGSLLLGLQRRGRAGDGRRHRRLPHGPADRAVRGASAARDILRRASVGLGAPHPVRARGWAYAAGVGVQPLECGQGPVVHAAAARTRRRGPLRPHGRYAFPAHRPVRPLAPRPYARIVHV